MDWEEGLSALLVNLQSVRLVVPAAWSASTRRARGRLAANVKAVHKRHPPAASFAKHLSLSQAPALKTPSSYINQPPPFAKHLLQPQPVCTHTSS